MHAVAKMIIRIVIAAQINEIQNKTVLRYLQAMRLRMLKLIVI